MSELASLFTLDPAVDFLNHGSFGACPRAVQEAQTVWRARLEREPVRFFVDELEELLDEARGAVAGFVGADAADLAFVSNATQGAASVLASVALEPGDEILRTSHGYNALNNAIDVTCARTGARAVVADVPFPVDNEQAIVDAILAAVTPRTRLAVIDHITSPTALVLPIERIVELLDVRGIDTLVDGAHAPGQVALDLEALGAAYFVGNLHKWCCAPKGAAILHVRKDRQERIHPVVTSHGKNSQRSDRSRFRLEFDWTGTQDPTAWLSVPTALRHLEQAVPGGWPMIMAMNHALAVAARRIIADTARLDLPCPDTMLGSMAALQLPPARQPAGPQTSLLQPDALKHKLQHGYGIQVPISPWPGGRLIRISAQLYNRPEQYTRLANALLAELA